MKFLNFLLLLYFSAILLPNTVYGLNFKSTPYRKLTTRYDKYFRKYSKRYFGAGFDWKWFKAQAVAESQLNNSAQSWVNAKGIMQLMPRTFEDIQNKNPLFKDINEPRWNIAAGIFYDSTLYLKWKADRPFIDRMNFTLASYNAGFRTIINAQKECAFLGLNENLWKNIEDIAPKVKRWRHKETIGYVNKINLMIKEWKY